MKRRASEWHSMRLEVLEKRTRTCCRLWLKERLSMLQGQDE